jgi:hypothetical protein
VDETYIQSHKHIVFLLISNRKFPLRLLVRCRERLERFDGLGLQNLDAEFDVAGGVLVAGLHFPSVSNQSVGVGVIIGRT